MYNYKGIFSGSTLVFENNKWEYLCNISGIRKSDIKPKYLYNVITIIVISTTIIFWLKIIIVLMTCL